MTLKTWKQAANLTSGALMSLALACVVVPVIDLPGANEAHAGGGNGGGQGNGNGHGGEAEHDGGHGNGHGNGNGNGHGNGNGNGRGAVASELGSLNAAHASDRAMENAAPNSMVGQISEYRGAVVEEMDLSAATFAEAHATVAEDFEATLEGISELGEDAVDALGGLLGLD